MTTDLDPRRLLIFREVARLGSLSAAATALGWTQPAVGQHMQRLERDVGIPLMLRSVRGITLTEAGTALLAHADALSARLTVAEAELQAFASMELGTLSLAAFPSGAATLVPPALAKLQSRAPALEVRLTEAEPPEARALVAAGDADLALVFEHAPRSGAPRPRPATQQRGAVEEGDLLLLPLLEDPLLAVLPAGHRLAGRARPIALGDLAGERWVAGCPRCEENLLVTTEAAGFVPDVRHRTDDYVVAQRLVAEGLAVTLLPGLALLAAPGKGVAVQAVRTSPKRQVFVLLRAEMMQSAAVVATAEALRTVADRTAKRLVSLS
ncbi:LysR family transcriptional regulator [Streptomyces sp. SID13031]|uniref:LysR family transcriptional regulator n=1 Tax=Streptomyces sp. SID13031 TaxID=2706046 RepID=UPI0013CA2E8A|nr:LysR family transcriptional regulator [Streptomyces sp. SID13031]NEA34131.1 LysR family transcriptional regulator [Streptomyces sp. SID13031]